MGNSTSQRVNSSSTGLDFSISVTGYLTGFYKQKPTFVPKHSPAAGLTVIFRETIPFNSNSDHIVFPPPLTAIQLLYSAPAELWNWNYPKPRDFPATHTITIRDGILIPTTRPDDVIRLEEYTCIVCTKDDDNPRMTHLYGDRIIDCQTIQESFKNRKKDRQKSIISEMMGFAMGTSSPLQSSSSTYHHHPPFPSFSSSSPPFFFQRNTHDFSKKRRIYACMQNHENDDVSCGRRAILFVGISVLPFLNLKSKAAENLAPDELEDSAREHELNQIAEVQPTQRDASPNPFLTLSSGLGIVASGVLGAFYALAQKEKSADNATIESMKAKLVEKEAAIVSMQKSFESKLVNEKEERSEQIRKMNQEKQALTSQLSSANSTVNGLGKELQKEKKFIQDLKNEIDRLTADLEKALDDKEELKMQVKDKLFTIEVLQERINLLTSDIKDKDDNLANLGSAIAAKESEFEKLSSIYEQTRVELADSRSEIEGMKQEILKLEKELELKRFGIDDLNAQIRSLCDEKNVITEELDSAKKEYTELTLSSEQKTASDAKLLEETEKKLEAVIEKLECALVEVDKNEGLINELTDERDSLRKALDFEVGKVGSLEDELLVVRRTVDDAKNEASELRKHLELSRITCKELEAKVSRVEAEYSEAKLALQRNFEKLKQTAEMLADELSSTKAVSEKTNEELKRVSLELAESSENRDNLREELDEAYKRLESGIHELKEEKKHVVSLTKEVSRLEGEIMNERESRRSMETDLEEATRALDEMNQNTVILSRELEISKTKISGLEDEKEALYRSLDEQKRAIQEARENMEDAHSVIVKLGAEKESLEKKGGKLEKELGAAKGEILRLRSEMRSSSVTAESVKKKGSEEKVRKNGSEDEKAAVAVKKVGRRKKIVSKQNES
ncbi:hypothetical protein L6452_07658 [Arctium lappa]|uniref:Uncharacterized protein n=1 Tax=Arctium lappa TaxID=4217 RepID=A0ACB9EMI4_ARCLA|nr:hypothetical protein L6452_07658 [Arctium lappa]